MSTIYVFLARAIYGQNSIGLNIGANSTTSGYLSDFNFERILLVFRFIFYLFSTSMGIAWSTPIVLVGIIVLCFKNRTTLDLRMFLFNLHFSIFLVLFIWQGNEVAYGQRLIGLTPFMCFLALKLKDLKFLKYRYYFQPLTYIGYLYFYSSQNLTLRMGENLYGNITKCLQGYYSFLFKELFYIENIISVLSRTIMSNVFKFLI